MKKVKSGQLRYKNITYHRTVTQITSPGFELLEKISFLGIATGYTLAPIEYIFIASYYRQLSVDFQMKNYTIKTSIVSPEGPKARADKIGFNFMIFIMIFVENCM